MNGRMSALLSWYLILGSLIWITLEPATHLPYIGVAY